MQGKIKQGKASASFKKLEKPIWRPKGRQLNKFRSMLFTLLKTNCCISLSCNLWRFMVKHRIDTENSMSNFFFEKQVILIIFFWNYIFGIQLEINKKQLLNSKYSNTLLFPRIWSTLNFLQKSIIKLLEREYFQRPIYFSESSDN